MRTTAMSPEDLDDEPDWDSPVTLELTPAAIIHTLFQSAESVHTGWDSCVDTALAVAETTVLDEDSINHCRLVEQRYVEGEQEEVTWHDWTVELKLGEVYMSAHWRTTDPGSRAEWDWCAREAENAFANACVLVGRRVRRGLVIEEPSPNPRVIKTRH